MLFLKLHFAELFSADHEAAKVMNITLAEGEHRPFSLEGGQIPTVVGTLSFQPFCKTSDLANEPRKSISEMRPMYSWPAQTAIAWDPSLHLAC